MLNVIVVVAIALAILAPAVLLSGWVVMLCLGALSHIFVVPTLAIGFWPAVLVSFIISLLFGGVARD